MHTRKYMLIYATIHTDALTQTDGHAASMASEMQKLQDTLDLVRKERDEYKLHLDEQLELNNQLLVEMGELSNDLQANMDEIAQLRQSQTQTQKQTQEQQEPVATPTTPTSSSLSVSPWPTPSPSSSAPAASSVSGNVAIGDQDQDQDQTRLVRALEVKLAAVTANFEMLQVEADQQITGKFIYYIIDGLL